MGSAQSTSCEQLSGSCSVKIGDYRVDGDLNELRNETVTVLETGLYRERCKNGRGIILHDFVGFRVRSEDGDIFRIKAEKLASPVGIFVTRPLRWDRDVEVTYRCENLEDCGEIRMEDLLAILTEPSPDYNLMSDNCWSYADATFKQVIRRFSETPSLSPERRSDLARFLNNAPPVMPGEVLDSARNASIAAAPAYIISALGASAVAAVVAAATPLPTQIANFYIALRCAGYPITPDAVEKGLDAMIKARAHAPQILRALQGYRSGVFTNSATKAVSAPLITRAFDYLVSLKAFIIKCVLRVPFLGPVLWAVAGVLTVYALVHLFMLCRHATSEQPFNRWWRSLILNGGVAHTMAATQAVHAPLITHSVLHLVSSKALMMSTMIVKGAVCAAPFLWPVAVAIAGVVTVYVVYKVVTFVMDGTSWGQSIKKRLRSLFPGRRLKQAQGLPSM